MGYLSHWQVLFVNILEVYVSLRFEILSCACHSGMKSIIYSDKLSSLHAIPHMLRLMHTVCREHTHTRMHARTHAHTHKHTQPCNSDV